MERKETGRREGEGVLGEEGDLWGRGVKGVKNHFSCCIPTLKGLKPR